MLHRFFIFALLLFVYPTIAQKDFYAIDKIREIHLTFPEKNWDRKLDSLKQLGNDDRLLGSAMIDGKKYEKVGVRYKGNSSYANVRNSGHAKLPFNIKLDEEIQGQALPGGYQTLKLSNGFRDPSFLREVLSYEIAAKYMPSPKANFVKLYVNDTYLGLYTNVESVDNRFLDNYYGEHKGAFIKCDPDWNAPDLAHCPDGDKASLMYLGPDTTCYMGLYEMKSDSGWTELLRLTEILNKHPEQIENILDIDYTLWMLAFDNVLVNLDSYIGRLCHNYYLYRTASGQFYPMIWDMNLSFGGFQYTGLSNSALSVKEMQELSLFLHYKEQNPKRPLIKNLLANDLYRKIYVAHAKTILEENFTNGSFEKRAKELQTLIAPSVEKDTHQLYSVAAFKQNLDTTTKAGTTDIVGLLELMKKRTEYLSTHPLMKKEAPVIKEVKHTASGKTQVLITASVEAPQKVWLMYRYGKSDKFKAVELKDDGENGDKKAADAIWTGLLDKKENLQYYIVAEGETTASLSPERASFEFYEVKDNSTAGK